MRKNIRKRLVAAVLAAALIVDLLQLPENAMQAAAKEMNIETAVSGNDVGADMDSEEGEEELAAEELSQDEQQRTAETDNVMDAETLTASEDQTETQEECFTEEVLHIGQIKNLEEEESRDLEELIQHAEIEGTYDTPVILSLYSQIRLFADRGIETGDEGDVEKTLTWSILRGEAGTEPGTTNLADAEDDWTAFETVSRVQGLILQEETDQGSGFYRTLLLTANGLGTDERYDHYIRATFCYTRGQSEHIEITTVPVTVTVATDVEENETASAAEAEDAEDAEDEIRRDETREEAMTGTDTAAETEAENTAAETEEENAEGEDPMTGEEVSDVFTEEQDGGTLLLDESSEAGEEQDSPIFAADDLKVSKLTLNRASATMNPGDTLRLSAAIVPEGLGRKVNWTSSNADAAVVDEQGNITAVAEGQAEIIANCDGKTAVACIDVEQTDADRNNDRPVDKDGNVIAITDEVWITGFERESEALTYTGGKITQSIRVYHKSTLLTEKTDYTLTYKNNTNAAAYNAVKAPSVTIKMKGQYSGSRTLYFTIAPRNINEDGAQGYEQVVSYSRKVSIPAPTVYFGSKKLTAKKDFVCDYSTLPEEYTKGDAYEDGAVYEYTVNGTGNFTGSFRMKLAVVKTKTLNFATAVITLDQKQYEYHGTALSASDVGITAVKLNKQTLDGSLYEYQVYADGVGTGYLEVYPSAVGRAAGYRGLKKVNVKVVGDRSIKSAAPGDAWQDTIVFSQERIRADGGIMQKKTDVLRFGVGDSTTILTEGVDYTVKYSNHKKVGTATITFTGMGRYTGSLKKTYKITPNMELRVQWHDTDADGNPKAVYVKGGAVPQFDLVEAHESKDVYILSSKTDYTVKVKGNKKLGTMTCEISGKGNYKGYQSVSEVEVVSADISQGTISASDKQYSTKLNAWKSAVTIKDANGKKLVAGTDYDKILRYRYAGMEDGLPPQPDTIVYVTVTGINNYEGSSVTGSYRVYRTSVSKMTIVIDTQEYTGKEIELSAGDIHLYASKSDFKNGNEIAEPCYEIIAYSSNIKAGTAKVMLRGRGEYGGTRTCSFKITKKQYAAVRATGISLDETSLSLSVGNSRQLTATVSPADAWNKTVLWSVSNSNIVTVSQEGLLTAVKAGSATVTATAQDTGKKATCRVQVAVVPVTSFSLNAENIRQDEGTCYQLTAVNIEPADATRSTILWKSTDPEIASVDADGLVSLHKAGMAVISAYVGGFVRKCLVIVDSTMEETAPEGDYLTPQMFRTSDEDDDTRAFNDAVSNLPEKGGTVYVPAGTYKIDVRTGIVIDRNDVKLVMSQGAVLQVIGNSEESYDVIHVKDCGRVEISGGQIAGERYQHSGKSGEWGMGIGVYDSGAVTINGVKISDCWGDGIYLGSHHEMSASPAPGCNEITITNCELYNNRRNNLSIVCADNVIVDSCRFDDANGTAPEYGIDIETNNPDNPCENITISNSTFKGNAQGSIGIMTAADQVVISGCTLNGAFVNYAGTNVTIADTQINAETDARIGISLVDGTTINDGSAEEDLLVAFFSAAEDSYTCYEYNIDSSNRMSHSMREDSDSPSGKVLRLERQSEGTKDAGYYFDLSELTEDDASLLEKGSVYRFEYVVRGSGQWGIKTDQTGWYPCVPMSDKFSTGIMTYQASAAKSCRLMLYAVDRSEGMYLEIDSIRIYQVR